MIILYNFFYEIFYKQEDELLEDEINEESNIVLSKIN